MSEQRQGSVCPSARENSGVVARLLGDASQPSMDLSIMAHELTPKQGQPYLDPHAVVRRLRSAFNYVDADMGRATEDLEEGIKYMLTAREVFSDERIEKARQAKGRSIDIILADEPESISLRFLIEPDERLFIDYESEQHEEAARSLLERVALVLDYEIELV